MNKATVGLIVVNVLAGVGIIVFATSNGSAPGTETDAVSYNVEVKSISADDKDALPVILKDLDKQRKNRMTARYFLPAPGERNALTDLVDGMVMEGMRRNLPISSSFDKLLDEEGVVKGDKYKKKTQFKKIMKEYLQKVYEIQRGKEEGDVLAEQEQMKSRLSSEMGLDGSRLNRLIEIEKSQKSNRQMKVFEQLLIRDEDKLNADQRKQVQEVLTGDQTTMFDPPMKEREVYDRSDKVLDGVSQVLNKDQAAHFRYFQEYHWHSYDVNEMNDMPTF